MNKRRCKVRKDLKTEVDGIYSYRRPSCLAHGAYKLPVVHRLEDASWG